MEQNGQIALKPDQHLLFEVWDSNLSGSRTPMCQASVPLNTILGAFAAEMKPDTKKAGKMDDCFDAGVVGSVSAEIQRAVRKGLLKSDTSPRQEGEERKMEIEAFQFEPASARTKKLDLRPVQLTLDLADLLNEPPYSEQAPEGRPAGWSGKGMEMSRSGTPYNTGVSWSSGYGAGGTVSLWKTRRPGEAEVVSASTPMSSTPSPVLTVTVAVRHLGDGTKPQPKMYATGRQFEMEPLTAPSPITCLFPLPAIILAGHACGAIFVWDGTGRIKVPLHRFQAHIDYPVQQIIWLRSKNLIVSKSDKDPLLRVWDGASFGLRRTLSLRGKSIQCMMPFASVGSGVKNKDQKMMLSWSSASDQCLSTYRC